MHKSFQEVLQPTLEPTLTWKKLGDVQYRKKDLKDEPKKTRPHETLTNANFKVHYRNK